MDTIWVTILVLILAVIAVSLTAFIATRPERFRVHRSAVIGAPPDTVFPLINDLKQWAHWSPWEKKDLNMTRTFEGPDAGVGAVYAWRGDKNVGEGRMTVVESDPNQKIDMRLEFFKPFAATNQSHFVLTPTDAGTKIDWIMEGENTLMGKVISLFLNMDKMIGKDFEEGLAALNTAAVSRNASAAAKS